MFLRNEKLKITLMLIDMHEYRLLNGWSKDFKKGSSRYERIPTKICDSLNLSTKKDYLFFFPDDLQSPFTVKQYSEVLRINKRLAGLMLNIMNHLDVIRVTDKQKNAYLYEICK